jgi:DNA transposition AAA+ family ATPase
MNASTNNHNAVDKINTAPVRKEFNEALRQRLKEYAIEEDLTNAELGLELGVHSTAVSKYLNGRPDGNVVRLEAVAADVLHNAARRRAIKIELFETNVSLEVNAACETIRKTNDMAVVHGPAGIGKTSGCELFVRFNPAALFITIKAWQRNANGIEALVWEQLATADWNGNERRCTYMERKLKNSNRLLIVDNAHRLKAAGLEYLFDFHDATGIPVALVGNPEVLELIKRNDQMFSRIGLCIAISKPDHSKYKIVQQIVEQIAPEANGYLNDAGAVVVEQHGHLRALKKQVSLAKELKEHNPKLSWEVAFKQAHTQLIRDYPLK